ncbi:MAG: DEAD/DEAH box helicase [Streptosporangiaceae bacterium]|nr:DEAD/DEAH box helicase [Streptosporangiaceae bacterium]
MALSAAAIGNVIAGSPEQMRENAFGVLSGIAVLGSGGDTAQSRNLLLRALDRRADLGSVKPVVDALIRQHGLFPYLDEPEMLGAADRLAYEAHRPPGADDLVFHAKQAEVYRLLADGHNVVLSAPTSFGKSLIIDGIIATGRYTTIVIIVPTIALIDETRRRLTRRFRDQYKIVTQPSQPPGERTLYILTQERFLDIPAERFSELGFFAIDEFYKLGSPKDDERSVLLNQTFHRLHATGAQFYLLGPNIDSLSRQVHERLEFQFVSTDYQTVSLDIEWHPARQKELREAVITKCRTLLGPTLLYVRSPARAREVARWLLDAGLGRTERDLDDAANWVARAYHPQWLVPRALRNGIGVHHGKIPRALAHHMVRLFNEGKLPWLIVTSTLIEGVNTAAKNVIIVDNKIAKRNLDFFTYSNICGRSGRMFKHFVGKVVVYGQPPEPQATTVDIPAYSQGRDAPLSLLIQLPWNELTPASRERLRPYFEQQLINVSTIREAAGIDPEAILNIARQFHQDPRGWSARLAWSGRPTYEQLKSVCALIYRLAGAKYRGGAASPEQLAMRIDLIRRHHGAIRQLADAQMQFARTKADEAVEDVLDFIREWCSHLFPRLLMVVQSISEDVLHRHGLPAGDYKHYAASVEAQFRPPMLTTLEEYGLPAPLTAQLQRFLPIDQPLDQIDAVLQRLRDLPPISGLSSFEEDMLRDTINGL